MINGFKIDSVQTNPEETLLGLSAEGYSVASNLSSKIQGRVYSLTTTPQLENDIFINVKEDAYIPTKVAPAVLDNLPAPQGGTVLDVGCGSGILGIGLCKKGADKLVGIDPNPSALLLSKKNAQANGIKNAEFLSLEKFLLDQKEFLGKVDYIIANIPQTPGKFNSGEKGNRHILDWIRKGKDLLSQEGSLFLLLFSYSAPSESLEAMKEGYRVEKVKEFFFPVPGSLDRARAKNMSAENLCTLYSINGAGPSVVNPADYENDESLHSRAMLYKLQLKQS